MYHHGLWRLWLLFSNYMFGDSLLTGWNFMSCSCRSLTPLQISEATSQCVSLLFSYSAPQIPATSAPLSSDFYDLVSARPIFSAWEPFLGSWSKICLSTESWENHGACLVNILFMWITSLGCLFPMSENNSFLYFKQFSSCLWSERMSRTDYSHSEKQNLELLFKNLLLNRNKIKIKWKTSGYNWKNSSSKYHLIVLWMILWKIKYTMICSALPASL